MGEHYPGEWGHMSGHCPWHFSVTLRLLGLACSLPVIIQPVFRFPKIAAFYFMSQGVPANPCFVTSEQNVPIGEFRGTEKASSAAVQLKCGFIS